MLPDSTRNGGTLVSAHKVIAITMFNAHFWDALQTNLTQSINECVDSLTMPDDHSIWEGDAHTLRSVLYMLCGIMRFHFRWFLFALYRRTAARCQRLGETRSLNQTVKRNARRFPNDFMFQLTEQEWSLISSQFVMTSRMKRPKKSLPYAFTELGALMLSSVLRSPVADETSIKITRAFVAMRQMLTFSTLPEKVVTLAQELYTSSKKR